MDRYKFDKARLQKYLPQLRACAGLSIEELATKVGLTKQFISYLENHLDKPMKKLHYLGIRLVFNEEICKNPENINLRDCYDMVFSDPIFFKDNKERVEYAIYQAVEDTKKHVKLERKLNKKRGKNLVCKAGATSATLAIGGVAAAVFPMMFSAALIPLGIGVAAALKKKNNADGKDNSSNANKIPERPSQSIIHAAWLSDIIESQDE